MAILRVHIPLYERVFAVPGVLQEPVIVFGVQDILINRNAHFVNSADLTFWQKVKRAGYHLRERFRAAKDTHHSDLKVSPDFALNTLGELLRGRGVKDLTEMDLFDHRATLRYDMNEPVPESEHEKYGALLDIGSIEHVFNISQCIENCLRMVRVGGYYFVHTPVKGCYGHGLHAVHPEAYVGALELNGFEVVMHEYCSWLDGRPIDSPDEAENVIIWLVAKKKVSMDKFVTPQQGYWKPTYEAMAAKSALEPL